MSQNRAAFPSLNPSVPEPVMSPPMAPAYRSPQTTRISHDFPSLPSTAGGRGGTTISGSGGGGGSSGSGGGKKKSTPSSSPNVTRNEPFPSLPTGGSVRSTELFPELLPPGQSYRNNPYFSGSSSPTTSVWSTRGRGGGGGGGGGGGTARGTAKKKGK
eukprot:TRINITY_DN4674_c0_g1_i6.p1 TRINITY_DN4674_c0_g1~~TRINITY_DN4674_c0_g1_i6.p1  ORF type:complete len:158 (-),score=66.36 TRINITY_DN4674_c0_g1_i6:109-582(-)